MIVSIRTRAKKPGDREPGREPDGRPSALPAADGSEGAGLPPWAVVAAWAVLLGLLTAISAGFGNDAVATEIFGSAATLILMVAVAVWLDLRFRPYRAVLRLPVRLGGVFLFAVTATVAWLSLAFGEFMLMLAVVPFAGAVGLEVAARRYAASEATAPRRGR